MIFQTSTLHIRTRTIKNMIPIVGNNVEIITQKLYQLLRHPHEKVVVRIGASITKRSTTRLNKSNVRVSKNLNGGLFGVQDFIRIQDCHGVFSLSINVVWLNSMEKIVPKNFVMVNKKWGRSPIFICQNTLRLLGFRLEPQPS